MNYGIVQAEISKCKGRDQMKSIIKKAPENMRDRLKIHAKTILYLRRLE